MNDKFAIEGLTFDDVLLLPAKSSVHPADVTVSTRFTRRITLQIPIVSAAMDTVTESRLAIAIAREGGIGVIHRNLTIEDQVDEVDKVKRSEAGMIVEPVTLAPDQSLRDALTVMERYHISGVPITEHGRLVGILTNRDLRFEENFDQPIGGVMTRENLRTVPVGTTLEEAKEILHRYRIEKLPVVDDEFRLRGLITVKDIQKKMQFPNATKDERGRLQVAAAIGVVGDSRVRARELVQAGVDCLVVDTAHGHSDAVYGMVDWLKSQFDIDVIAGNVATKEGAQDLVSAGADAIKVGIGAGTICTTRIVAGAGVPQLTAILDCSDVAAKHDVPVIGDGGIRYSGDFAKAIAAGSDSVMLGGMLAGVDESPGDIMLYQGERYKEYRGMGSLGAMKARGFSKDRYRMEGIDEVAKLVPEGVEGRVPYKGPVGNIIFQLIGGLKAGMGYVGAGTIKDLQKAKFVRITSASLIESHPHDIFITKEAPNYGR